MSEPRPGDRPPPAPLGVQVLEQYSVAIVCAASGLYVLRCLPSILFPQGALMTTLLLLVGAALGAAGLAAALAYAFFLLTQPAANSPAAAAAAAAAHPASPTRRPQRSGRRPGARPVTAAGDVPPHAFCKEGELSGVVYTAPPSKFGPEDTITEWPPTTSGPAAFAKKWRASVSQGTLVLTPIVDPQPQSPPPPQQQQRQPGAKRQGAAEGEAVTGGGEAAGEQAAAVVGGEAEASGEGAAAAPAAAPPPPPAKVGIPLENCTVEVVTGGLKGRSAWIRRAPLLVTHPQWNLLDGEQGFYLFAEDPASKQQWYHALSWWCEGGGQARGAVVEGLYAAFCALMAQRSALEYPQEAVAEEGELSEANGNGSGGNGSGGSGNDAEPGQPAAGRRTWKSWGAQKMQVVKKRVQERRRGGRGGGAEAAPQQLPASAPAAAPDAAPERLSPVHVRQQQPALPPPQPTPFESAASPPGTPAAGAAAARPAGAADPPAGAPPAQPLAAELQSLESFIDARWMHSRKIPMPPTIPQAVSLSPTRAPRHAASGESATSTLGEEVGGGYATPPLGASPARPGLLAASPAKPRQGATGAEGLQPPSSLPGTPLRLRRESEHADAAEQQAQQQQQQQQGPTAPGSASPAKRPGGQAPLATGPPLQGPHLEGSEPDREASGPGGPQQPQARRAAPSGGVGLPPGMPPLVAVDYAVNMLLTRAGFDLLRNPAFQAVVKQRIQRRLALLNTPDYVQSLEVVDVALGSSVPSVRNFAALPSPDDAVWPQVAFDLYYQGSFTITLETKVDIRDAAAWGRFDRALSRLEGRGGGGAGEEGGGAGIKGVSASSPELGSLSPRASEAGDEDAGELLTGEEQLLAVEHSPDSAPALDTAGSAEGGAGAAGRRGQFMSKLRASAGRKLRQLAETTATRISKMPLRVSLTFSVLEGTMLAWVPPPPGNRLFVSFLRPPRLEVAAKPEVGGRLLKYSYHIARVSSWIEMRMRAALTKNMVFPGGSDFVLSMFMDLDNPHVADPLPGLTHPQRGPAAAGAARQLQQSPAGGAGAAVRGELGAALTLLEGAVGSPAAAAAMAAGRRDQHSRSAPQLSSGSPRAGGEAGLRQQRQEQAPGQRQEHPDQEAGEGFRAEGWDGSLPQSPPNSSAAGVRQAPSAPRPVPARPPAGAGAAAAGAPPQRLSEGGEREAGRAGASWPGLRPSLRHSAPPGADGSGGSLDGGAGAARRRVSKSVSFPDSEQAQQAQHEPQQAQHEQAQAARAAAAAAGDAAPASPGALNASVSATKAEQVDEVQLAAGDEAVAPADDSAAALAPAAAGIEEEPVQPAPAELAAPEEPELITAEQRSQEAERPAAVVAAAQAESGHFVGAATMGPGRTSMPAASPRQASSAPSSPAVAGGGGASKLSRGLQYLRQQSQQARQAQQGQQAHPQPEASAATGAGDQPAGSQGQQGQGNAQGNGNLKAQGRRVAGLMMSRMSQAGKALAQHVQQARQQGQQGGSAGAEPSLRRLHSD